MERGRIIRRKERRERGEREWREGQRGERVERRRKRRREAEEDLGGEPAERREGKSKGTHASKRPGKKIRENHEEDIHRENRAQNLPEWLEASKEKVGERERERRMTEVE